MTSCDVFISYQRDERRRVELMAQKLKSVGLTVWFDKRLAPGAGFDEEIAGALKAARSVLVCWTPNAISSSWVRSEAAMAHTANKLVAAFLEPTELVPPFNLVHAESLIDWSGEDDHAGWAKLLARIASTCGQPNLIEWANLMGEGDAKAVRSWITAQPAGPLRSTTRFWLSEMDAIPMLGMARAQQKPRARKGGARLLAYSVVAIAALGGIGGFVHWQSRATAPAAAATAHVPSIAPSQLSAAVTPPARTKPTPASNGQGTVPALVAAPSGNSAVVSPPSAAPIDIANETVLRIAFGKMVDFETGRVSDDGGPGYDFELTYTTFFRFHARGKARIQLVGFPGAPNRRMCEDEMSAGRMMDDSFVRGPHSLPFQCFITADGHRGFLRGVRLGRTSEEGIEIAITFFR